MRRVRTFIVPFATILAIVLVATFGSSSSGNPGISTKVVADPKFPSGSTMSKLHQAGTLRVGTRYDHPGLSARNLRGHQEGFEIDMVEYLAAQLGIPSDNIKWVEANSANREQFLIQNKVDMVVATYTDSAERRKVIDFAGPYQDIKYDLVVLKGNPKHLTAPDKPRGARICSTVGGTVSVFVRKQFPDTRLVEFDVSSKCIDALLNGSVDALVTHAPIGAGYVGQDPTHLQMADASIGTEAWSIGIPKGSTDFCKWIDSELRTYAENGDMLRSWDSYLGRYTKTKAELPAPKPCS